VAEENGVGVVRARITDERNVFVANHLKIIRWPGPGLGVFFLFYFTSAVSVNDVTDTGFTNTTN
jgi:hypothetical protein